MKLRIAVLLAAVGMVVTAADKPGPEAGAETALLPDPAVANAPTAPGQAKPLVLKIAVNDIYCGKTACDCIADIATRSYDKLLGELKSKHGITLEFTYFMEVFDLQKAVLANQYDGVLCKPWTALQYTGRTGAEFKRVADLQDPENHPLMTGVFLSLAKSPIRSLSDLQGKRVAFGQTDAYEKNQAPLAMLAARDINLGGQEFHSSCGENLSALMDGKVDVAVVSSYALSASCAVDFAKPEDFRTIAETGKMPLTSLLLDLKKVPLADARRVQAALLALSGDHVPDDLQGKGFVPPVSWRPVIPPSDKP